MEPDQIIERLGTDNPPTVEELTAAQTALTEVQETLKADIRAAKDGSLDDLLAMKGDYDNITQALASVGEALTEAEAKRDEILSAVGDDPQDDEADTDDDEDEDADDVEAKAPVAASATVVRQTVARVKARPVEVVSEPDDLSRVHTSLSLLGRDRDTISDAEIGEAFEKAARQNKGSKSTVLSIKHELHPDRTLDGNASANERKLLDLFGANPVVPVTASGGCCSIPEPIYDQPLIGSLDRPIRGAFDVLNASRGAVQNYPPVCIPDEGADVWTCVQDAAVDEEDPATWKSCVEVACDVSETTLVEAAYKCLTIGDFQSRFAPEQWRAYAFQTDKLLTRLLEARLFNWLAEAATSVYVGDVVTGSTYANFIKTNIRIAAAIRQDQRLGDAQIVSVGSNLIYSAIAEDTLTRRLNMTEDVEFFKDKVDRVLAEFGITYVGSDDVADMSAFSYSGTLPDYPGTLPMVTLPAGSAKVLDGGEKNLGVDFVDFNLARQNKIAAFSESWEGLLVRNCNVVFSTIPVEDCDLGCPPVAS